MPESGKNRNGLGSAIIGGVSSLATALANAGRRKKAQERANKFNIEQWQRENAYNHPTQQMQRLSEAGLNPRLIYGDSVSGAAGNASQAPRMEPINQDFENPLDDIRKFADLRGQQASTRLTDARTTHEASKQYETDVKAMNQSNVNDYYTHSRQTQFDIMKMELADRKVDLASKMIDLQVKDENQRHLLKQLAAQASTAASEAQIKQVEAVLAKQGIMKGSGLYQTIMSGTFMQGRKVAEGVGKMKNNPLNFQNFKK